jgi:hypothetical protein
VEQWHGVQQQHQDIPEPRRQTLQQTLSSGDVTDESAPSLSRG